MEQKVRVHLDGFQDPLVGRLIGDIKGESLEKVYGRTVAATIRSTGAAMVINHEEQFEDPLLGYRVEFEDPALGRRLEEVFRDGRKAKIAYSSDGRELRIGY